jgi:hypothetical protein
VSIGVLPAESGGPRRHDLDAPVDEHELEGLVLDGEMEEDSANGSSGGDQLPPSAGGGPGGVPDAGRANGARGGAGRSAPAKGTRRPAAGKRTRA